MIDPGEYIRRRLYPARGRRYQIHRGDIHRRELLLSGEYVKTTEPNTVRLIYAPPEATRLFFGSAGEIHTGQEREVKMTGTNASDASAEEMGELLLGGLDMSKLTAVSVTADKLFPPDLNGEVTARSVEVAGPDENGTYRLRQIGN